MAKHKITISGQNIEVTEALRDHTQAKVDRIATHLEQITSIDITFKVEKHNHIAEGQVHAPGHPVHATASSESMYKSVDLLVDKLVRQITKVKEKMNDHRD